MIKPFCYSNSPPPSVSPSLAKEGDKGGEFASGKPWQLLQEHVISPEFPKRRSFCKVRHDSTSSQGMQSVSA